MYDFYLLIPCYNNIEGLIVSLQSVKYPKEKHCILIVDDGSTHPVTPEILPKELYTFHIIEILRLAENKGITEALNTGLNFILKKNDASLIARLDCGDICHPLRFIRQVEEFNNDQELMLLGSWCCFKKKNSNQQYIYHTALTHMSIVRQMHWKCSFIHPTVMFSKKVIEESGVYPSEYTYAEDYAFFFKICLTHTVKILQEILVTSEISSLGISATKRKAQRAAIIRVLKQFSIYKYLMFVGILRQYVLYLMPETMLLYIKRRIF
ncbi:MAG: glycosyltransferase [Sphingobacteriales bacterium]|nr:MAG: glycosyltransferase [Sphingobacteriales bacterium]